MVLAVQMTIYIQQLQLFDNVADVFVVHVGQVPQVQVVILTFFFPVPGAGRGEDSRDSCCHVTCLPSC